MTLITQTGSTIVTQAGQPIGIRPVDPAGDWPDAAALATLRVRVGLQPDDTSKDPDISAIWGIATLLAEEYLDRFLRPGKYTEGFTHIDAKTVSLKGYPLTSMPVVTDHGGLRSIQFHVDGEKGLIYFDGEIVAHALSIEYDCAPPKSVYLALAMLFDSLWSTAMASGGAVAAGGIKSISSAGASITYFDPSSGGGSGGINSDSGLPSGVAAMLNPFRRTYC